MDEKLQSDIPLSSELLGGIPVESFCPTFNYQKNPQLVRNNIVIMSVNTFYKYGSFYFLEEVIAQATAVLVIVKHTDNFNTNWWHVEEVFEMIKEREEFEFSYEPPMQRSAVITTLNNCSSFSTCFSRNGELMLRPGPRVLTLEEHLLKIRKENNMFVMI